MVGVTETRLRPRFSGVCIVCIWYSVMDLLGRELFAYHWHPTGVSAVQEPHFHMSSIPPTILPERTGSPKVEELIMSPRSLSHPSNRAHRFGAFLIIELGVGPGRADWEAVLERSERYLTLGWSRTDDSGR